MAHEYQFSDVAIPQQHFCLTLPLRDFSIGHRLLFMRQRNPLVFGEEAAFNNLSVETKIFWLLESVTICNQTYAYRMQLEKEPTRKILKAQAKTTKRWRKDRERAQSVFLITGRIDAGKYPDLNDWWALEIALFRNYINSSRIVTDFKYKREPFPFLPCGPVPDADKGRSLGCPHESTLIQFLMQSRFVNSVAEAMEYPFALAEMHYLTHLEREGHIRILNTEEIEFKEQCDARDLEAAKAAGFKTVEEHIEFIKGNAKKKNEEAAAKAGKSGLATEVPEELKTDDAEISRKKAMKDYLPPGASVNTISVQPK